MSGNKILISKKGPFFINIQLFEKLVEAGIAQPYSLARHDPVLINAFEQLYGSCSNDAEIININVDKYRIQLLGNQEVVITPDDNWIIIENKTSEAASSNLSFDEIKAEWTKLSNIKTLHDLSDISEFKHPPIREVVRKANAFNKMCKDLSPAAIIDGMAKLLLLIESAATKDGIKFRA